MQLYMMVHLFFEWIEDEFVRPLQIVSDGKFMWVLLVRGYEYHQLQAMQQYT